MKNNRTFGERASDLLASFGGSWKFIISFTFCVFGWIIINTFVFMNPFDPFPYILLNLILSCLASIQAPLILMSQQRQEVKDRIRDEADFYLNKKSELEVRQLHNKVDELDSRLDRLVNMMGLIETDLFALLQGKMKSKGEKNELARNYNTRFMPGNKDPGEGET